MAPSIKAGRISISPRFTKSMRRTATALFPCKQARNRDRRGAPEARGDRRVRSPRASSEGADGLAGIESGALSCVPTESGFLRFKLPELDIRRQPDAARSSRPSSRNSTGRLRRPMKRRRLCHGKEAPGASTAGPVRPTRRCAGLAKARPTREFRAARFVSRTRGS